MIVEKLIIKMCIVFIFSTDLTDIGLEAEVMNVDHVSTNHAVDHPDIVAIRKRNRRNQSDQNQTVISRISK